MVAGTINTQITIRYVHNGHRMSARRNKSSDCRIRDRHGSTFMSDTILHRGIDGCIITHIPTSHAPHELTANLTSHSAPGVVRRLYPR